MTQRRALDSEDIIGSIYHYSSKMTMVRVYLFADLRAGIVQIGNTIEFDAIVYDDMDAMLAAAQANEIMVIPVLLDYLMADEIDVENDTPIGERPDLLTTHRDAFVSLLSEFLATYGTHPAIYAWDIINEPELATAVSIPDREIFLADMVDAIHNHTVH